MKRILAVIFAFALAMTLVACGGETQPAGESGEATAVPTEEVAEWKVFLTEYEAWVDDYIAITEKYQANPTDITLAEDYTALANETSDWSAKMEEIEAELAESPEALEEYMAAIARITEKLAKVIE